VARRRGVRRVVSPPGFSSYYPVDAQESGGSPVELFYEEYEALRMADYDLMTHEEASALMGVSRATFARVYESARRKIASALVETRVIRTVFGNACFQGRWFLCGDCFTRFTLPEGFDDISCPFCRSDNIEAVKRHSDADGHNFER
jgi:predicted DNA-binding protein (UPF0251 family)